MGDTGQGGGGLQRRCGSAEQAPPGVRDWGEQETPVLLWQLPWWSCKLSVMLLPIPSLPGCAQCGGTDWAAKVPVPG